METQKIDTAEQEEEAVKATFAVRVQFRQNATWQGTITWMDQKRTQHFRSELEMITLMQEAMDSRFPAITSEEDAPPWKEAYPESESDTPAGNRRQ